MSLLSPSIRGGLFAVAAAAAVPLPSRATADDASIRPFHVHVSDSEIADMRRRIVARIPLGRLAALSDIADLVTFLASDRAAFISAGPGFVAVGPQRPVR